MQYLFRVKKRRYFLCFHWWQKVNLKILDICPDEQSSVGVLAVRYKERFHISPITWFLSRPLSIHSKTEFINFLRKIYIDKLGDGYSLVGCGKYALRNEDIDRVIEDICNNLVWEKNSK